MNFIHSFRCSFFGCSAIALWMMHSVIHSLVRSLVSIHSLIVSDVFIHSFTWSLMCSFVRLEDSSIVRYIVSYLLWPSRGWRKGRGIPTGRIELLWWDWSAVLRCSHLSGLYMEGNYRGWNFDIYIFTRVFVTDWEEEEDKMMRGKWREKYGGWAAFLELWMSYEKKHRICCEWATFRWVSYLQQKRLSCRRYASIRVRIKVRNPKEWRGRDIRVIVKIATIGWFVCMSGQICYGRSVAMNSWFVCMSCQCLSVI